MIVRRPHAERGHTRLGWLDSRHTFSFGNYVDRDQMGFRALRVINEDRVEPGQGFGSHPHRDMEIISYVLSGELEHKDSMGNGSVIRSGDVQRMSAGTGVVHSEFNPSASEPVHFLQIWIVPASEGIEPSYQQHHFPQAERQGRWRLLASPGGRDGSLSVHQDAEMYGAVLANGDTLERALENGRGAWLQVARGEVELRGSERLQSGDGAALIDEPRVVVSALAPAEVLLFDLA